MYGIYIHIPFCQSKCRYCDFASYPSKIHLQGQYVSRLKEEIKLRKGICADTVYIGGGTPSILSEDNIKELLHCVNETFCLADNIEFTVEVNPGTIDRRKAEILKQYGVNRISMGAQSFVDSELSVLGRIHTSYDTARTFDMLRESGFDNISIDIMYALPGQDLHSLDKTISKALSLKPEHVSCYGLKFEENTPFYSMLSSGEVEECPEDTFADMYDYICKSLADLGYVHYEISNFCKEGFESRHNLKYWQGTDYVGFGASASSKEGSRRYTMSPYIEDFLSGNKYTEDYVLDIREQMIEFVILGMRVINQGVSKAEFRQRFGRELEDVFSRALTKCRPYTEEDETSIKLRREAVLVSNSILCEFMDI